LWNGEISDIIRSGKNLLIVAHGNSIRSIVKYLDNVSEKGKVWKYSIDITELDIPTAVPLIYEFDKDLKPVKHYYLADPEELEKKVQSVKNQAKAGNSKLWCYILFM
jgi:2,3-bisphosphoglycerate-dependent phosphoglycerate mutase